MTTIYTKTAINIKTPQLQQEIAENVDIHHGVEYITFNEPNELIIAFDDSLDSSEEEALDLVISEHIPQTDTEITQDIDYFEAYDTLGILNVGNSWTDVPFDVERRKATVFLHTENSAEVGVQESGIYVINARVSIRQLSSNSKSIAKIRLVKFSGDTYIEVPGSLSSILSYDSITGEASANFNITLDMESNNRIKLQIMRSSGSGTLVLSSNGSSLSIYRFKNIKGETGDPGGTTVNVLHNSSVVASNIRDIDFEGDVNVENLGNNRVLVTVTGQDLNVLTYQIIGIDGYLSEPMLFLADTTRDNKILSIETTVLNFAEHDITDKEWIQIGVADNANIGFVMPYTGTIVRIMAQCADNKNATQSIRLYKNTDDVGTIITVTGSGNVYGISTNLNIDFNAGDLLRLRAIVNTVGVESVFAPADTNFLIWVKWRKV